MKNEVILVSARSQKLAEKIRAVMETGLFNATDICTSGSETLRKARMINPDLLVIDYELGDMTGYQVSEVIISENLGSIILLANQIQKDYVEHNFESPHLICLRKPLNKAVLINSVEIALKNRKSIRVFETEIERLKKDIQSRKIIEKAKGILMKKLEIDEEEAYTKMRKKSMDNQMPMKKIANMIIAAIDGEEK